MNIVKGQEVHLNQMCDLWNEVVSEENFYKTMTYSEYKDRMYAFSEFSYEGVFLAFDDKILIGFIIGYVRESNLKTGYLNTIIVKREYQNKKVGKELLNTLENYFISRDRKSSVAVHFLPACYSWYIPRYGKDDHPCAPAIRINSKEYFFLMREGYSISAIEDAFHLPLANYELPNSVIKILEESKKEGIEIEFYDPNKHYGLEEFYKDINIGAFEHEIKTNLELEKPYPFLVISNKGSIEGWTGALWNETSGRGHFDGIAISPKLRGKGLGKALFSMLTYKSKLNGAKFMTFRTGKDNSARYIYLGAGFKVIQTFAMMSKELVKDKKE